MKKLVLTLLVLITSLSLSAQDFNLKQVNIGNTALYQGKYLTTYLVREKALKPGTASRVFYIYNTVRVTGSSISLPALTNLSRASWKQESPTHLVVVAHSQPFHALNGRRGNPRLGFKAPKYVRGLNPVSETESTKQFITKRFFDLGTVINNGVLNL